MKKIPDIISSKDILYLEDAFNWNFNICKKALAYSKTLTDTNLIEQCQTIYKSHKEILNKILNIIGG